MSKEELWCEFEKSGKIEDYLKYKLDSNQVVENEEVNETIEGEGSSN